MLEVSIIGLILIALIVFFIKCTYKRDEFPKNMIKNWERKEFDIKSEGIAEIFINEGEKLKVLQLTDIHYDYSNSKKEKTLELVASEISTNEPDFIAVTGDWCGDKKKVAENSRVVFDIIDRYGIPWAPVFGNHDDDGDMSRADYIKLFAEYKNCFFKVGYTDIGGIGNYIVNVKSKESGKLLMSLFMIDSNSNISVQKYQPISKKQIEWYSWAVSGLKKVYEQDNANGKILPSLAFFHIPLTEFGEANMDKAAILSGENLYKPSAPKENTGLAAVILENQSTKAVIVGHDHTNNAVMDYKGLKLIYGVQSGMCDKTLNTAAMSGATVISMSADGEIDVERCAFEM